MIAYDLCECLQSTDLFLEKKIAGKMMYFLWIDHLPRYKGIIFKESLYKLLINTKWSLKSSTDVYLEHETSFAYCL